MRRVGVAIVGGGVIGSSAAFFLARAGSVGPIVMIEPDPTYALAATPRASGGVRQLFSLPENILMSRFGLEFFARFAEEVAVDGEAPDLSWKPQGYLFLVPERGVGILEQNHRVQTSLGVRAELLDRSAVHARFPSLHVDDIGAAVFSPDDGWLDPNAVLQGFRRKARSLGVDIIADRVVGLRRSGRWIVRIGSGEELEAEVVIDAAGAWAAEVCAMIGLDLPVEPMRRFAHYFEPAAHGIEPLPFIKDLDHLAFFPEGKGYSGGVVDRGEPAGFNFTVDHTYFERVVWPAVAHRLPALGELRLVRTWAGIYDMNRLDGNMVLGSWEGQDGFYVAGGFSGHGLMHAPAVGRALAELIAHGGFQTIDLGRMGTRRLVERKPYRELGIV